MTKRLLIASLASLMVFVASACTAQNSSKEQLSHGYSVDRDAVYYRDLKLDIDPQGFEVLSEHWVKNDRQVYFMFSPRNGQEIRAGLWSEGEDGDLYRLNVLLGLFERPVDAGSFELVTDYLATDKNQVYYFNARPPTKTPSVLRGADPGSIEVIDENYARDESKVFYTRRHFGPCTIEQADPKSFAVLSERYSKDSDHAFHECALVEDADAETFGVTSGFLAADSENVFRSGKLVPGADPATFSHLKHRFSNLNFYTDKQHVYYFRDIVEDADPNTFEVIASYFSKDDQHAYFCSRKCHKIVGADVRTFQAATVTSNWANARVYARDKGSVYFCAELQERDPCTPLAGSDPDSFEYIGQYLSRDTSNVFFRETNVNGADAATFEIFQADDHKGVYMARDKNSIYKIQRVGAPDFYEFEIDSSASGQ